MLQAIIDRMLLTWQLLRDPRVPLWTKVIPVAAIAYVLSPLDLIPDFLIGLGQLDDLGIIIGGMRLFEAVVPGYLVDEHRIAIARRHKPMEVVESPGYRVLDSEDKTE